MPSRRKTSRRVRVVDRRATRCPPVRCTARRRARSSSRSGRRGCARPCGAGRCRGSRARAAGSSGPTDRTRRGRSRRAPWRVPCLRRGARRRRRRRTRTPRSRRGASRSGDGCGSPSRPFSSTARPSSIDCCTEATTSGTPESFDLAVAVVDDLGEVVTGVDVHQRERKARRPERLLGQPQHHRGVLAAREEQHRALELGRDLTHDVDRFGLERVEMSESGFRHAPRAPCFAVDDGKV